MEGSGSVAFSCAAVKRMKARETKRMALLKIVSFMASTVTNSVLQENLANMQGLERVVLRHFMR